MNNSTVDLNSSIVDLLWLRPYQTDPQTKLTQSIELAEILTRLADHRIQIESLEEFTHSRLRIRVRKDQLILIALCIEELPTGLYAG